MNGEDHNRKVLCDIARSAFEVVSRLLARDQSLARKLRSPTTGSRQIYREECLTVEMAATLQEQLPDRVEITLFTPPEEARTGADWYWRFERSDRAIHARVQAKRVQRTEFDQEDANGHIDIDEPQLDRLIQVTNEASGKLPGLEAWAATYARFDATPPCGSGNLQSCCHHRHHAECAQHGPSLWIAHAQELRRQLAGERRPSVHTIIQHSLPAAPCAVTERDRRPSVHTIIQHSLRLDCMLPRIVGPDKDHGPARKEFELRSGRGTYQDSVATIEGDTLLRKEFEGALRIMV